MTQAKSTKGKVYWVVKWVGPLGFRGPRLPSPYRSRSGWSKHAKDATVFTMLKGGRAVLRRAREEQAQKCASAGLPPYSGWIKLIRCRQRA